MSQGGVPTSARVGAAQQELILDHYRRPRNRGPLPGAAARAELRNPLCGDEIALAIQLDDAGRVADVRFTGSGCSISQAAASMLTGLLKGQTLTGAEALGVRFQQLLAGSAEAAADPSLGDLRALSGVARLPMRVKCAMLAWRAFDEAVRSLARR